MAKVSVSAEGQDCIASGLVLADVAERFEIAIVDGEERLTLQCSFVEETRRGLGTVEPGITFAGIDEQRARVVLSNIAWAGGGPLSFGPLAVAVFKQRSLSLIFHVRHAGTTVEMLYSFWLRAD